MCQLLERRRAESEGFCLSLTYQQISFLLLSPGVHPEASAAHRPAGEEQGALGCAEAAISSDPSYAEHQEHICRSMGEGSVESDPPKKAVPCLLHIP